jgi:serine/threonine-protein kinase
MKSPPSSELGRAGQVVAGKFRLDAVIGRGGMGSVWSATHTGLGHRLALKLIAREYVRSPEALRRFDAEAKAAARLQSRHVVQVFDNGTLDDGTPFIAMELLSGENVSERIEHEGPLSLAQTVDIMAQCCKALGRAHAAGIVHRDIKPDNIFLAREPDDDADVAKILDFGVAKMALDETESLVTGTGALLGTPLYMSPEQIRGARDVDLRGDLYSLGLVAYTMLTGRVAITGETFGDILIKICTQPLPSLVATVPTLPYAMEAWFQKACAREPGDRYASAQEFIDALRTASGTIATHPGGLPRMASAPTLESAAAAGSRTPSFGHSAAVAATLAAPAVSTGPPLPAAITGTAGSPPAFSQSGAAVSVTAAGIPRRPTSALVWGGVLAGLLAVGGAAVFVVSLRHGDGAGSSAPSSTTAVVAAPSATAAVTLAPVASGAPSASVDDAASLAATHSAAAPHGTALPGIATALPPPVVPAGHGSATAPSPPVRSNKPIVVGY